MEHPIITIFCTLALIQVISCQYIGNQLNAGFNYNGQPFSGNANRLAPSLPGPGLVGPGSGAAGLSRSFAVTSTSPIQPTGISVLAENLGIEGPLSVGGQLPFLGTIGVEGALPAIGSGTVSYGCGSGNVGIISEGPAGPGIPGPYSMAGQAFGPAGPGLANPGFGQNLAAPGYTGAGAGAYGHSLASPGFGFGSGGPGLGASLGGQGLGYNGVSSNIAGAVYK